MNTDESKVLADSYEHLQKEWIKENGLKPGDTIRVTKYWNYKDNQFSFAPHHGIVGWPIKVIEIRDNCIVASNPASRDGCVPVPCFAIEVIPDRGSRADSIVLKPRQEKRDVHSV